MSRSRPDTTWFKKPMDKTLPRGTAGWIKVNADDIVVLLPPPGDEWSVSDADLTDYRSFRAQCVEQGMIEVSTPSRYSNPDTNRYVTEEYRWECAKAVIRHRDEDEVLPCGHSGLSTLSTDPPEYACMARCCDDTFGREETRAALGME